MSLKYQKKPSSHKEKLSQRNRLIMTMSDKGYSPRQLSAIFKLEQATIALIIRTNNAKTHNSRSTKPS
jgi:hypothetical protein